MIDVFTLCAGSNPHYIAIFPQIAHYGKDSSFSLSYRRCFVLLKKFFARTFWIVRESVKYKYQKPLFYGAIQAQVLRCNRYTEAHLSPETFFIPFERQKEKSLYFARAYFITGIIRL